MLERILVLIVIIGFVFYFSNKKEKKMTSELINYFVTKGYAILDIRLLTVDNRSNGIKFFIQKFTKMRGNQNRPFYRVEAQAYLNQPLIFTIKTRNFFSKAFGTNEGTLNLFEDLNISTPNPYQLQTIFSNQNLNSRLQFFKSVIIKCEARPIGDFTSIQTEINYDIRSVQFVVEFIEQLVSVVNNTANFVVDNKIEEYRCFNCNTPISFFGDFCRFCGAVAPKCVICYDDPEPEEDVIMFDCCKSYAHRDHGITWLNKENQCPYCKQFKPEIITVMDQK